MADRTQLFSDDLAQRYAASVAASPALRDRVIHEVMRKADLPRLGTSGAANAYVLIVGSEFGISRDRPVYSEDTMGRDGWRDLWQLRIGEPNPHLDPRWSKYRHVTHLWHRLFSWLPEALGATEMAHAMFAWANLSVTAGNEELGTVSTHRQGMDRHVAPLIEASGARVIVATNNPTRDEIDRWARDLGADRVAIADMDAWRLVVAGRRVIAAKVGHPSRGVSRATFIRRLRALIDALD